MKQLALEIESQNRRTLELEEQDMAKKESKNQNVISETARLALEAMQKEMRFEQLTIKEQQLRQRQIQMEMKKKIEQEIQKQVKINNFFFFVI